jgi:hypothetical protein
MKVTTLAFLSPAFMMACGPVETATSPGSTSEELAHTSAALASCHSFEVDFAGCREFAGIGKVPLASARPLVPARYALAPSFDGDTTAAVIVVRGSACSGTSVDGKKSAAADVSQIGISITGAGTDPTATINNYLLWYATDLGVLNGKLTAAGVDADVDQSLLFQFIGPATPPTNGVLRLASSPPHGPPYTAQGPAVAPTAAPVPFIATWWQDGKKGSVEMRTVFPAIQFGSSTVTLTTPAGSALAALIGGTTLTFPFLDSFNAFPAAQMTVCGG